MMYLSSIYHEYQVTKIPPAKDVNTAKERLADKSLHCYDWWMCTKDL